MLDGAGVLVAAGGLDGVAGAGAVDQDTLLADGGAGFGKAGIDGGFVSDVDIAEYAAKLFCERFALLGVEVEQCDLHAVAGEFAGGCGAEAGSATGYDGGDVRIEFHGPLPSLFSKTADFNYNAPRRAQCLTQRKS